MGSLTRTIALAPGAADSRLCPTTPGLIQSSRADSGDSSSAESLRESSRPAVAPVAEDGRVRDNLLKGMQWDDHYGTIKALYQERGLPLKEVARIMREEHGFFATENMYKKQLKKWNLDTKRLRPKDYAHILFEQEQREKAGKKVSVIEVRGRFLPWREVRRAQRRIPAIRSEWSEDCARHIVLRSPEPQTIQLPSALRPALVPADDTTTSFHVADYLGDYFVHCFRSQKWEMGTGIPRNQLSAIRNLRKWSELAISGVELITSGQTARGFEKISKLMDLTPTIVREEDPAMIAFLLLVRHYFIPKEHAKLGKTIEKFFQGVSATIHGANHPITVTLARFPPVAFSVFNSALRAGTERKLEYKERPCDRMGESEYRRRMLVARELGKCGEAIYARKWKLADEMLAALAHPDIVSSPLCMHECMQVVGVLEVFSAQDGVAVYRAKNKWNLILEGIYDNAAPVLEETDPHLAHDRLQTEFYSHVMGFKSLRMELPVEELE